MRATALVTMLALAGVSGLSIDAARAAPPPPPGTGTVMPPPPPPGPCATRLCGPQHWNFEPTTAPGLGSPGALQGWSGRINTSTFSTNGLVAGSVVGARRVLNAAASSVVPPGHEQIVSMRSLPSIGGDYWDVPYHTGYEGTFWLGSFENHMTLGSPLESSRGESATMDVVSPEFSIRTSGPRYIHFLAGGGCSPNVHVSLEQRIYSRPGVVGCTKPENTVIAAEATVRRECGPGGNNINCVVARQQLAVAQAALVACLDASGGVAGTVTIADPVWEPASTSLVLPGGERIYSAPRRHVRSADRCSEAMSRVRWDLQDFIGRVEDTGYRIRVVDDSTTAHISVDDFWVTSNETVPEPKIPVWGAADLHAHLMNEKGTMAFGGDGRPESRALWGSAVGPIESMTRCNYTHTTNDESFNSHSDEVTGTTFTLFRKLGLDTLDGAGREELSHSTNGGAPGNWTDWPLWSTALHQQMHETWVRRAFDGGLRLMLAAVGNAEAIGFGLAGERGNPFMSDQDALALQIPAIFGFASRNATWAEVARTPQDARRIIRAGKMAIVIGAELDHIMDSCDADVTTLHHHVAREWGSAGAWSFGHGLSLSFDDEDANTLVGGIAASFGSLLVSSQVMHVGTHPRTCTPLQIEARLDAIYRAGVRQIIPMHFSDNMLGGYAITDALFTSNAVFGDADAIPPRLMTQAQATSAGIDLRTFGNDIGARLNAPLWVRLDIEQLLSPGAHLPPGAARSLADFLFGRCIDDDGFRALAAFFSLGASEVACGTSELVSLLYEIPRELTPWEGAVDTAALGAFTLPASQRVGTEPGMLPSHINARGLQPDGERFITEMMRRGMLVDVQHASELSRRRILELAGTYPVMASHGGAILDDVRDRPNENTLSRAQLDRVYQRAARGMMGAGTQSARAFKDQLHDVRIAMSDPDFAMALGTDMNGFDWHSFPRFGPEGFFRSTPGERRNAVELGFAGRMVNYAPYAAATNKRSTGPAAACDGCTWPSTRDGAPALAPHTIARGGSVVRTFDINFDGYSHYGMTPDFLQEVRAVGATVGDMAAVFRSAENTIRMWESSCAQAYARSSQPESITQGCGPRGDYP